ncbi:hypothetical protein [Catelliglobosispora koreensis]|uniref:hypothetical protein n=1 Tax=Catelliglobosispora koreensis TaxID=129052 RepID=UPI0012FC2F36|nr:hypothetical protein [Catelliglobosispora koreensis]
MHHRSKAAPSLRRRCPSPHQIASTMRESLQHSGLLTGAPLLPLRWNRDTDLTISAVQALDPWLKDARPIVWREGFLAQPVVRFTGERDASGNLAEGFLTAFTNLSYVQRIAHPRQLADLLDSWFTALSAVGLHAGRLTVQGSLQTWHRPPVSGITLFFEADGVGLGDAVLLWNSQQPTFMAADIGSGLERLRWAISGQAWPEAAFGQECAYYESPLLDAIRTAVLMLMSGIRPAHRGPGAALRGVARAIEPNLARTGLSRVVRAQCAYWRGLGVTGMAWPAITSALEDEVLRHPRPAGRRNAKR